MAKTKKRRKGSKGTRNDRKRRKVEKHVGELKYELKGLKSQRNRVARKVKTLTQRLQSELGAVSFEGVKECIERAKASGHEDVIKLGKAELERRNNPTPIRIRKVIEDDWTEDRRVRNEWRARTWADHYGYEWNSTAKDISMRGFHRDAQIPAILDADLKSQKFVGADDGETVTWGDWMGRKDAKNKAGRTHEIPLRLLVRDGLGRVMIDYISRIDIMKTIEQRYIGGPWIVVGTPPNYVTIKRRDGGKNGPIVMATSIEPFTTFGEIEGDLFLDDLTEEAERFFDEVLQGGGDPSELYGGRVGKTTHRQIIANYLAICKACITRNLDAGKLNDQAREAWPYLRDAVIFEFPASAYTTLHETHKSYFRGRARAIVGKAKKRKDERLQTFLKLSADAAKAHPFPDHLPFPATYLAYGKGLPTQMITGDDQVVLEARRTEDGHKEDSILLAHLLLANGDVFAFIGMPFTGIQLDEALPEELVIVVVYQRKDGEWRSPDMMEPFITTTLIEYINDHKTFTEEGRRGLGYRTLIDKTAKQMKIKPPIPPPFYVVYLKDQLVKERLRRQQRQARKIEWQHRWHTRGAWNIRFSRGPLPLDEKLEAKLRKRKYQVFTVSRPDGDLTAELAKRTIPPKQPDEWLAVLKYWRGPHIKGPIDKPLIESVRRSTKEWRTP